MFVKVMSSEEKCCEGTVLEVFKSLECKKCQTEIKLL